MATRSWSRLRVAGVPAGIDGAASATATVFLKRTSGIPFRSNKVGAVAGMRRVSSIRAAWPRTRMAVRGQASTDPAHHRG